MHLDTSWLSLLGLNVSDADRIARMADMILDVKTVRPVGAPITMTQVKGRGLRGNGGTVSMVWPGEKRRMSMQYKRRHRRQTRQSFPFSVITRNAGSVLGTEMMEWCDQWGEMTRAWDTSGGTYYFTCKAHATMFILAFKGRDEQDS